MEDKYYADDPKVENVYKQARKMRDKYEYAKEGLTYEEGERIYKNSKSMIDAYEDDMLKTFEGQDTKFKELKNFKEEYKNSPEMKKLSETKYGSQEWFNARDKVFESQKNLEKKYSSSILKEFGIDEPDDYVAQKIFNKSKSPLLDYTYSWYDSDYHSISNPLTGDRDYGLTEYDAYKKWANE